MFNGNEDLRKQRMSNNASHILGDNFRDYKRFIEIEKMNQMNNPLLGGSSQASNNNINSMNTLNYRKQIANNNFNVRPLSQISRSKIVSPMSNNLPMLNTLNNPSNQISQLNNISTIDSNISSEIKSLKSLVSKIIENQNNINLQISDFSKVMTEQDGYIRLNNQKLNDHDNRITEILVSFNNYLQINENTKKTINELQNKIEDTVKFDDYTSFKEEVYSNITNSESKFKETFHNFNDIDLRLNELHKENENYQRFTLDKISTIQKEAMNSRIAAQNELIQLEDSKGQRYKEESEKINNMLNILESNLNEEIQSRKKSIEGLRKETLETFKRKDESINELKKMQLETEQNLIYLSKDYMSTFNDLITKHNEKYNIELKTIRSIIEAGLTKVDLKMDKDQKIYVENINNINSIINDLKSKLNTLDSYFKESITNIENKYDVYKDDINKESSKLNLVSTTLDKFMKESLELIQSKNEETVTQLKSDFNKELELLNNNEKDNKNELEKKINDLNEKIEDITTNLKMVKINNNDPKFGIGNNDTDANNADMFNSKEPHIELIREFCTKLFNDRIKPYQNSIDDFEKKINVVLIEKIDETKKNINQETQKTVEKSLEIVDSKILNLKQEINKKIESDKIILDGNTQSYILSSKKEIEDMLIAKYLSKDDYNNDSLKLKEDYSNLITKLGISGL